MAGGVLALALLVFGYWLGLIKSDGRRGPDERPGSGRPPRDAGALPEHPAEPKPDPSAELGPAPPVPAAPAADWIDAFIARLRVPRDLAGCFAQLGDRIARSDEQERALIGEALMRHLRDADPAIRSGCAMCLISYPEEAFEPLCSALQSEPDREVRKSVVYTLGQIGMEEGIEPLARAIEGDRNTFGGVGSVGKITINAIGKIGGPRAAGVLSALWEDPNLNRDSKITVISSLGTAGDPSSFDLVVGALHTEGDEGVRRISAYAPAQLAVRNETDPRVIARVRPVLRKCLRDATTEVRVHAAWALAWVGDAQDIPVLRALAESDEGSETVIQHPRWKGRVEKTVYPVREKARFAAEQIAKRIRSE
jgi:HEAT repeat protein